MASGDLILKANFTQDKSVTTLWHADTGSTVQSQYVYVSCACFDAYFTLDKNWGSWGRDTTITAWYYNGSEWIEAYTHTISLGQFDSGFYEAHFRHNWTGYSQTGDQPNYHLWCIRVDFPELYDKYFYLQRGSYYYGAADWTGELIYGTSGEFYYTGSSSDDSGAVSGFKVSNLRGGLLTSNGKSVFFTQDRR